MAEYFIGLMSGTSADGIDAALVELGARQCQLVAHHSHAIPEALRINLIRLSQPAPDEIKTMMQCDVQMGQLFAEAVITLLEQAGIPASQVTAIGSHGQTLRHYPVDEYPSTLQIGDANIIAELTGITTITDFRRRDMAAGGQGAPLVPAFHRVIFQSSDDLVILNIGGIANITLLPADSTKPVTGFDTGPGNCLMDNWIQQALSHNYDRAGEWGASGHVHPSLLERLLNDPYFATSAPKSTGREYFNLTWLQPALDVFHDLSPKDVQATLCELTARSISDAITRMMPTAKRILVCGGGVHNLHLMQRLEELLPEQLVVSTASERIDPDWIEAMAFAWLAKQTLEKRPGNLPDVTGASHPVILGAIYQA